MLNLDIKNIFPGMRFARDIHFYDVTLEEMIEVKKGTIMTYMLLDRLKASGVQEVYIDHIPDSFEPQHNIDEVLKKDAVTSIQYVAANFLKVPEGVQTAQMEDIGETALALVSEMVQHKNIMVNILDLKMHDDYTFHHSLSVAVVALAIGIELNLGTQALYELTLGGLLHDIGKVMVPQEILNKPDRLTNREFEIIKMHPVHAGVHLLKKNFVTENTFKGIIYHHEKWDGTGYPNGLKETQIPLFARILAVADVYDALTSNRPYRQPEQPSEAIEYIMGASGTFFDVDIVKAFLHRIAPYPAGTRVQLCDGRTATVVLNNPNHPLRPIIKISDSLRFYDLYRDADTLKITIQGHASP